MRQNANSVTTQVSGGETGTAATHIVFSRSTSGDWIANAREIPDMVRQARQHNDRFTGISLQLISGYYAQFLLPDEPCAGAGNIERCLAEWPGAEFDLQRLHAFEALVEIDLYRGQARAAWNRMEQIWPHVVRSGLLGLTLVETFAQALRARAALACAGCESGEKARKSLLDVARRSAKWLHRSKAKYAAGLAYMIDGGIAACLGDRDRTREMLLRAEAELEANDMIPWLAAVRISVAPLLDGEAGRRKAEAGHSWMASQEIRRPDCITRMFLPMPPL